MTIEEAVKILNEQPTGDPEAAHGNADAVLLEFVPDEVRQAYKDLVIRARWWAFA